MIVRCAVNGEPLDSHDVFVCHHCGMPLCEEHGWVVASDDAFAGSASAASSLAGSAPATPPSSAAWAAWHSLTALARDLVRRRAVRRADTLVPRPAMHCRECADRSHKRAVKRHGWDDPRPAGGFAGRAGRP